MEDDQKERVERGKESGRKRRDARRAYCRRFSLSRREGANSSRRGASASRQRERGEGEGKGKGERERERID